MYATNCLHEWIPNSNLCTLTSRYRCHGPSPPLIVNATKPYLNRRFRLEPSVPAYFGTRHSKAPLLAPPADTGKHFPFTSRRIKMPGGGGLIRNHSFESGGVTVLIKIRWRVEQGHILGSDTVKDISSHRCFRKGVEMFYLSHIASPLLWHSKAHLFIFTVTQWRTSRHISRLLHIVGLFCKRAL